MKHKRLKLKREVVCTLVIIPTQAATNSSQAKHCSCEQVCEQ